jgi:hypothetical protein
MLRPIVITYFRSEDPIARERRLDTLAALLAKGVLRVIEQERKTAAEQQHGDTQAGRPDES